MIGTGHNFGHIGDYSVGQAQLFLDAITKEESAAMRNNLIAARAAVADNKSFKKMLKELDNG